MLSTEGLDGGRSFLARSNEMRRRGKGRSIANRWSDFLADLDRFRKDLAAQASGEVAFEAADHVARAIESGLVRPALIAELAAEARGFFAQADRMMPQRRDEVTLRWARLEITTARPQEALELLDEALMHARRGSMRDELVALQEEAWFAVYPT